MLPGLQHRHLPEAQMQEKTPGKAQAIPNSRLVYRIIFLGLP
jgi:hypothetical protein